MVGSATRYVSFSPPLNSLLLTSSSYASSPPTPTYSSILLPLVPLMLSFPGRLSHLFFASHLSGVRTLDDWYNVFRSHVNKLGGRYAVSLYGGLIGLLNFVYPDYPWDKAKYQRFQAELGNFFLRLLVLAPLPSALILLLFLSLHSPHLLILPPHLSFLLTFLLSLLTLGGKTQNYIANIIQQVLPPSTSIYYNHAHPELRSIDGGLMELDIWVCEKKQ